VGKFKKPAEEWYDMSEEMTDNKNIYKATCVGYKTAKMRRYE